MLELLLALQLATAQQAPVEVFGLQIGQPISLPMCRSILPPEKGACLVKMKKGEKRGAVRFSTAEQPAIVRGDLAIIVLDGRLEGVSFDSFGGESSKWVLDKMTAKYGQPDSVDEGERQNAFGVKFPTTSAIWKDVNGLHVSYVSGLMGLKDASVLIQTHKAGADTAAEVAELRRNRREL